MKKKLVAFLGMGPSKEPPHYGLTRYGDGRFTSSGTPLVQAALIERAKESGQPFDEVVILGTKTVEERWIDTGELARHIGFQSFRFKRVPDGKTGDEFWALFNSVRDELAPVSETANGGCPDEVVLDITHGFRVQGMVAISALEYVISEWGRKRLTSVPVVSLSYGAFEAKTQADGVEVSPLWNLTSLVLAGRWNSAIDAVVRYGRGDDFDTLGKTLGKDQVMTAMELGDAGAALRPARYPAELSKAVGAFCDDLATGRIENLFLKTAPHLMKSLKSEEAGELSARLPAIRDAMEWLRENVSVLCADDVVSESGIRATAEYALLCGRLQRFAEQAAAVREGCVSLYGLRAGMPHPGPVLGSEEVDRIAFDDARSAVDHAWGESGSKIVAVNKIKDQAEKAAGRESLKSALGSAYAASELGQRVVTQRNDIEHLGLNKCPSSAQGLRAQLSKLSEEFAVLTSSLSVSGSTETGDRSKARFYNLSNHPISSWTEPQLGAATALNLGEVCDLPDGLPLVDPEASEEDIAALAREIAIAVTDAGAAGAYVAGEYCLAFALVVELQRRGVRCFAATTQRVVEEHAADGVVRSSTRHFVFGKWREYSSII